MAKSKRKRNKRYQGKDAAQQQVHVTKVTVPDRSRLGQYFYENRKRLAVYGAITGILVIVYAIFSFIFSLIF